MIIIELLIQSKLTDWYRSRLWHELGTILFIIYLFLLYKYVYKFVALVQEPV